MGDTELPTWLDSAFLTSVLQGKDDPPMTVTTFSASLAVTPGNNYTSRIYRLIVNYRVSGQDNSACIIVKAPIGDAALKKLVTEGDFFDKEPIIYNKLLPILNGLAKTEFGPTSYCNELNNAMIMADLKELGYEVGSRFDQLDFPHCSKVFSTLARFHAASVACNRDHPQVIELAGKEVLFNKGEKFDNTLRQWCQMGLDSVSKIVGELNISKEFEDITSKRVKTLADSVIALCEPKKIGLNVFNHGDLWVNNILFKHSSSGDVEDVRFIDFQLSKYGSPALDLMYFIWTSANEEVRESRLQELCEIYRVTLNHTLEELGCEERLTAEELHEDIRRAEDWTIFVICNNLPVIVYESGQAFNVEEFDSNDTNVVLSDKHFKHHNGKNFLRMLPKIVEHFFAWKRYYE